MTTTQKAKLGFFIVATCFMVYVAVLTVQFGNKLSRQTEQNFADAVRIMQGDK